jgi:hypothetical protein
MVTAKHQLFTISLFDLRLNYTMEYKLLQCLKIF